MQEWDPCLAKQELSNTSQTGQRCLCTQYTANFFPRTSWEKRVQTVCSQWLYWPWPCLCLVKELCYYLDTTSDLRQNKELVCLLSVRFWQGYLTCHYLLVDQADCDPVLWALWSGGPHLNQVKVHDVRAFAASWAFQSGVSLEQILSVCHWKLHNTFTQYYLKDVAWSDSELFHLGPVVAAQQINK